MREKSAMVLHAYVAYLVIIIFIACIVLSFINSQYFVSFVFLFVAIILSTGISVIQPNEAVGIMFIGKYLGSVREVGLFMTLPFTRKLKVSLKVQTADDFEVHIENEQQACKLNPIIVYRIVDSAKAVFNVEDYSHFIHVQVELAINDVVEEGAFDGFDKVAGDVLDTISSLQSQLAINIRKRLEIAGIELIEVKLITNS